MSEQEPHVPSACTDCGAGLETPLACGDCGTMMNSSIEVSPFGVLGLPKAYAIDRTELTRRVRRIARMVHPDFYAAAGSTLKALAEAHGARLNEAYEILKDDARRADWLVRHLDGPSEESERQMPQAFLMQVIEWNETLEEGADAAPGSPEQAGLEALESELTAQRAESLASVAAALEPLPPSGDGRLRAVRQTLNAIRYLDRTLRRLRDLRVGQPG